MRQRSSQIFILLFLTWMSQISCQRRLGKFVEVFAWRQISYNINNNHILYDRFSADDLDESTPGGRQSDFVFNDNDEDERNWNENNNHNHVNHPNRQERPIWSMRPTAAPTNPTTPSDESRRFFIQYNNVPMGVERVEDRVFITIPRRRYGIPSTVNYLDLSKDSNTLSPGLRPYPNLQESRRLTSVYRTRADQCGRLWMVDTGLLEIPNNPQQVQPPAIVIYDLRTNRQILRYPFKDSDIPAANTPTGLASITIDIDRDCNNAFAYVPDLTTFGLIVFSLRDNDSWRLTHNYFHFNPTASNLRSAGQSFQWSDGIFSLTLTNRNADGCKTAYFHPLISTQEFAVSTCVLKNRTASSDSNYWSTYSVVGDRGENSQSTMHGYHSGTNAIFYADIGRDAISCWNTGKKLAPENIALLAQDSQRMSYPSDLHVTGDDVWVMSNKLPRFGYSTLDTEEYNFYIYRGKAQDLVANTVCSEDIYDQPLGYSSANSC